MGRDVVPGFGRAVRDAREAAGMSRRELAAAAGTTYSGLTMIEKGERSASFRVALALAKVLDLDLNQFKGD